MEFKNFFKDKFILILFSIFIIISVFHIIYASYVQRGLFCDGLIWFLDILNQFHTNGAGLFPAGGHRTRAFANILNQSFLFFGYHLFHIKSKYILSVLYTLPLFLFSFITLFFHYLLAKRSKRYDIVVLSLILYGIFILPCQLYSIVEAMIAVSLYFLLWHYLIAKINYSNFDIFFIILLVIFSYNSSETIIYCGIISLITSFIVSRDETVIKNKIVKYFIGINGLLASIYVILFYTKVDSFYDSRLSEIYYDMLKVVKFDVHKYLYDIYYILVSVFIISVFLILIYRKKFNKITLLIITLFFGLLLSYFTIYNVYFVWSADFVSYRIILYIALPVLMLISLFVTIKKIDINKLNIIFYNTLTVVLLISIINTVYQVWTSKYFNSTKEAFLARISQEKEVLITPKQLEQFYSNTIIPYSCELYSFYPIAYSKNYKINRLITYDDVPSDIKCINIFYVDDNDNLHLPYFTELKKKTLFWDFSEVWDYINNNPEMKAKYYKPNN